jgi:hypothetical protein
MKKSKKKLTQKQIDIVTFINDHLGIADAYAFVIIDKNKQLCSQVSGDAQQLCYMGKVLDSKVTMGLASGIQDTTTTH